MKHTGRVYAVCENCGLIVYRDVGETFGDGQTDDDENPIWFLAGCKPVDDVESLRKVSCGCVHEATP